MAPSVPAVIRRKPTRSAGVKAPPVRRAAAMATAGDGVIMVVAFERFMRFIEAYQMSWPTAIIIPSRTASGVNSIPLSNAKGRRKRKPEAFLVAEITTGE